MHLLSPLDWFVFCAILLATVFATKMIGLLGPQAKAKSETYLDFLIAGRQLTLPLFVATLVSTWYGGIFGVTQIAYEQGIYNFVTQGVFWYVAYLFFALVLAPKLQASSASTLPELIGRLYGPRSRKLAAILNFFGVLPVAYALSAGILLQYLLGVSLMTGTFLGVLFVALYSFRSGFRAVVLAETVQAVVMVCAVVMIPLFSWAKWGGWSFLVERLPKTHFDWRGGQSAWATWVWGLIALGTLVDPSFYQRCFAAKDRKTAQWGIVVSTGIWICFDLSTTLGGMYARAVLPDTASNEAYLQYAIALLPNGLRGFFLAGVLATILSTLDSFLFIASSAVTHDMLPESIGRRKGVRQGSIFAVGLFAVALVPLFDGSIKAIWLTLGGLSAGALFFPVLLGMLSSYRLRDHEFVTICLVSISGMLVWRWYASFTAWSEIDPLYIGILVSLLTVLFFWFKRKLMGVWPSARRI